MNTGTVPVRSTHGLLCTVAYQIGSERPVYALEVRLFALGVCLYALEMLARFMFAFVCSRDLCMRSMCPY